MAYWPLDEPAGATTVRDVVAGKTGTVFGQVAFGVPGVSHTGLSIEKASELTSVDTVDDFDFAGATPFMVEVWTKPSLVQSSDKLLEKRNGQGYGWVTTADPAGPPDTNDPLELAPGYVGFLDEVAIYDHALAGDRVLAHRNAAAAR